MGIEYLLAAAQLIEEQEASTFNYKLTMYITKNYIMDVFIAIDVRDTSNILHVDCFFLIFS